VALIGYQEAAVMLGISVSTLRNWVSDGRVQVPYVRLAPRTVRFVPDDLQAWIDERRVQAKQCFSTRAERGD
jgi:excisionase family DNA binding protein